MDRGGIVLRQGLRRSLLLVFALATAAVLLVAPQAGTSAFISSAPPDAITPSATTEVLAPGGATTISPTLHLDALPPRADVVLAFDTTGSMGAAINDAKSDATSMVNQIQAAIPGAHFAIADFKDYPSVTDTTGASVLGYGGFAFGGSSDYPWRVDTDFTDNSGTITCANGTTGAPIDCALRKLTATGGSDEPEAYNRAFSETYKDTAELTYQANAAKFLLVLGDSLPHDATMNADFGGACPSTPPTDPGPDQKINTGDDLGTLAQLAALKARDTNVSFVTYNPHSIGGVDVAGCHAALAKYTGGSEITHTSGTASLGSQIVSLIKQAAARVDNVSFTVALVSNPPGTTVDSPSSWFTFKPSALGPATAPVDLPFDANVAVPAGQALGTYVFRVKAVADGITRGSEDVTVNVVANAITSVHVSTDETTLAAGVATAPYASIPASRIPFFTGATTTSTPYGSTPFGSTPFGSTPFGSTPYGSTPWGSTPYGSTPYGSTPYGSTPFGSTPWGSTPFGSTLLGFAPFGSTPFGSTPYGSTPFEHVLLSQLPLITGKTWADVLNGSPLAAQPLSSLSLADVMNDSIASTHLDLLKLSDLSFASSMWQGIPVGAVLLGRATLAQIPVPASLKTGGATTWQNVISRSGGCDTCTTSSNTFFGIGIAGALGSTNIGAIPFGSTPYGSTPGGTIPLTSMNIAGTRLAAVALGDISPLADIVDCTTFSCVGKTLGDAAAARAIKSDATLAKLFTDLPATNPALQMTLDEIVGAVLPMTAYPWEQIPIQGLQDVAGTKKNAHYHVTFSLNCSAGVSSVVKVLLPAGFFPVQGSSQFTWASAASSVDPGVSVQLGRPTSAVWTAPAAICPTGSTTTVPVTLNFAAYTGLTIGDQAATAAVNGVAAPESPSILVTQNQESNDDPATAPTIDDKGLVVGHVAASGDKEYYRFPLSGLDVNSRIVAFLKVPKNSDFDLTLNGPSAPPIQSTPFGSTALGSIPVPDQPVGVDNSNTTPQANTLADVPFGSTPFGSTPFGSTASGSVSQNRGDASEQAAMVLRATSSGYVTIGVSGYNGSHSDQPYALRVEVIPPPPLPKCQPRVGYDDATQIGPLPAPSTLPQSTQALFLVDRQRLAKLYGSGAASTIVAPASAGGAVGTNLATLAAQVNGAVLSVDGDANVRAAYGNWDTAAGACSPDAANGVVRAINDVVASYRSALPNLRYIVLLGTDTAVPMYRQPDPTLLSPELDEAPDLAFTTSGLTAANSLYAAVAQNQILTDGAYGAFTRVQALDHELPVPQVSISRMVETPADINGQINDFVDKNGTLSPSNSLTTGYDFLADGAAATNAALGSTGRFSSPLATNSLISATWNKSQLDSNFFGLSSIPGIGALYGHYNHYAFKPAAPDVAASLADVATTATEVPTSASFSTHVIFTVGCHGGLNVGDELAGTATPDAQYRDWAQAYAQDKIAAYIANTGFGYGDTDTVAASEKLMMLFAQEMNKSSHVLGDNWLSALTDYDLGAGVISAYDEKVMLEATYYGLPFWHFGPGTVTPPPSGLTPGSSGFTSFDVASAPVQTLTSSLTPKTGDGSTKFWEGPAGTLAVPYRPIQPLASLEVTNTNTAANKPARDVFITSLTTHDEADPNPAKAFPVVNATKNEPIPNFADSFWPAGFATLVRAPLFSGERDSVSINAGQYRPDSGVERLVDKIGFDVTYSNSTDVTRPLISQAGAVRAADGTTTIFIKATDASGIARVAALYNDASPQWSETEAFTLQPNGYYTATVSGLSANAQFGFEAMDKGGWVAQSWKKAENYQSATVLGDSSAPDSQVSTPLPGQVFTLNQQVKLDFTCSDSAAVASCTTSDPAGVASCGSATVQATAQATNLDTSTVGTHALAVTGSDLLGNKSTRCVQYYVRYTFSGFRPPVDNPPVLNIGKAGTTIPVKFALFDAAGVSVSQLNAVRAISSDKISCTNAPSDVIDLTVPDGTAGLKYDATGQQFVYNWQTQKSFAGTCRRFYLEFADGSVIRYADFQFK
jgi:hypothetical protein